MSSKAWVAGALAFALMAVVAQADASGIPKDQVDKKKIFWGNAESYNKAARVDYEKLIKATPEFKTMKDEKIERGSRKYWI